LDVARLTSNVLAFNCGSSSLKYAMFAGDQAILRSAIDRIGTGGVPDHGAAVHAALDEIDRRGFAQLAGIGHRLVHGGPDHTAPVRLDTDVVAALERVVPFAPLHLPAELRAIEAARTRYPNVPQVACFDTAFHATLPEIARRFALPEALDAAGVRRYGFHGLSYEHVVATLGAPRLSRAVLAHLGSGASMVAVRDGRSIETTMGFTPASGLVMGTRPGDLDPGLIVYLLDHGFDVRGLDRLVNREAGLLALSGTTSDMQTLLERRATEPRAAFAVDAFCYHARKAIGALAATLGGIDVLVFTGGIGEHAAAVRAEICRDLAHLGIVIDDSRNLTDGPVIGAGKCDVLIVRADEERTIARRTREILGLSSG
jgi:acetate kinase